MNKKDIIDTIFILAVFLVLLIMVESRGHKLLEVNELQNKVEQQIELIDALQQ